jgi:quercetin dioxygenase-like cupin family protein
VSKEVAMTDQLDGWDIHHDEDTDWMPWGEGDLARAKVLGEADGFVVALVEAKAGYVGGPHEHTNPEFLYVVDGTVRTQGVVLGPGDAYAAATGSVHTDFGAEGDATYLSIFRL